MAESSASNPGDGRERKDKFQPIVLTQQASAKEDKNEREVTFAVNRLKNVA